MNRFRFASSFTRSFAVTMVTLCLGAAGACGGDDTTATTPGVDGGQVTPGTDGATSSDALVATDTALPEPDPKCDTKQAQKLDDVWMIGADGGARTMKVHVPASYDPKRPTPVVFNFHGFGSNADQENLLAKMNAKADKETFVTVHAEGTVNSWNAGACCGEAVNQNIDDVAFVGKMIDALEDRLCVDTKRVFATGMSNGGFLSHRLGCELADRIAAIAPVAGVMGMPTCTPTRPISVMHFHGTADGLVPYNGNPSQNFIPVQTSFGDWAKRDGCTGQPEETFSKGDSKCSTYKTCAQGAEVTLCTVTGGGHTWPGGTPYPPLGYTTTDLVATDAMWDFFKRHPKS
jgi:polyhydroxybutyrate depolymerase